MAILTTADFEGEFELPVGQYINSKIDLYITQVEEDYLTDLLGHRLYSEFIAALAGTPDQKWVDLRDGDTYGTDDEFKFKGLKQMLKYFTYYEYMRYAEVQNSKIGNVVNDATNAEPAGTLGKMVIKRMYNKGVDIYCDAINYILDKNDPVEIYADLLHTRKGKIGLL